MADLREGVLSWVSEGPCGVPLVPQGGHLFPLRLSLFIWKERMNVPLLDKTVTPRLIPDHVCVHF